MRSETVLPEGTVTFLFTDIQGSTQLLRQLQDKYIDLLADHHRILREIFAKWHGREVDTEGDAFFVSFPKATEAVAAVVEAQRALANHGWPDGVTVRVRMGLHTGEPWTVKEGYVGMDVHRAARIAHTGHGGQVLLSETITPLVRGGLPEGVSLLDLGRHRLKDIESPERIHQLVIEDLPSEFPSLKTVGLIEPSDALTGGPVRLPDYLQASEGSPGQPLRPVFVGRDTEVGRLNEYLELALGGKGQMAFLSGDAGSGKSSLLNAFAAQAGNKYPDLLVVWGLCNAFGGRGDPYLPFRQILNALTGDVEAEWAAGTITNNQAKAAWEAMPIAVASLLKNGPDLLNMLLPLAPIQDRFASAYPAGHPLLTRLQEKAAEKTSAGQMEQSMLFEQVSAVLRRLSEQRPMIIILDDLQWADRGSLDLLFHMGRGLAGSRILFLVAYRPDVVTAEKDHPLRPLLDEFRRSYGDVWMDLNQVQARAFVDEMIDSELNQLDEAFRRTLFKRTGGHPLFTVELLRDMQERGDLVKDEAGAWTEGDSLNWDELPARVEGAIEARIGRLEEQLREILTVGSVEGESFTAQVVARIQEVKERRLLRTLSIELQRQHQLINEQADIDLGRMKLARYRFAHALFQQYLYNELSSRERALLHGEVADILEEIYTDRHGEIAVQLARHYLEAGEDDRALPYLIDAGDRARMLYAFEDAVQFYEDALDILKQRRDFEMAGQILMKLGQTYHGATQFERSSLAYQEGFMLLQRARAGSTSPDSTMPGRVLRTNLMEIPDLDPIVCHDLDSFRVTYQLFGCLVTLNRDLDIVPDMAESWKITDGGKTYTFKLQEGLTWSDGHPLTARDFAFRLQRDLSPDSESWIPNRWNDLKGALSYRRGDASVTDLGIDVIDHQTFRLELEKPSGTFLYELVDLAPIPCHVVKQHGPSWSSPDNIVTCGAYLLASWKESKPLVLKRNPNYYGNFGGNVSQIQFHSIETSAEIIEAYTKDELDLIELGRDMGIGIELHPEDYVSWPMFATTKINLNTYRFPFDNRNLRRSLALATDQRMIAEVGANGMVLPATGGIIPLGLVGHSPNSALPYDLDGAKQILADEGYPDGRGLPILRAIAPRRIRNIVEVLDFLWKEKLGLRIEWDLLDWRDFDEQFEQGLVHFYIDGVFAPTPNPDNLLGELPIPRQYWDDERFQSLVAEARTITDPVLRIEKYKEAETLISEEVPLIPIIYSQNNFLIKPWIKNYRPPHRTLDNWKDVIVEPH